MVWLVVWGGEWAALGFEWFWGFGLRGLGMRGWLLDSGIVRSCETYRGRKFGLLGGSG